MKEINIGENILRARKQQNLSIRDVSKLSNVTPSMLSQIERGHANPSVTSLKSIATALNIPLFTFFISDSSNNDYILKKEDRKKIIFPNNSNIKYEILTPGIKNDIEFSIMHLPSKRKAINPSNSKSGYIVYYILEGEVELIIGDEKSLLISEDSVKLPSGIDYIWNNPSDLEAKIILSVHN